MNCQLDEIQNIKRGIGFSKYESKVYQYISKLMELTLYIWKLYYSYYQRNYECNN
jgi:hypothetical protein